MQVPMVFGLTLFLLILGFVNCNYGFFTRIGNKDYFVENTNKVNWYVAANRCIQMHAQLTTIANATEMALLNDHLMSQGFSESDWIWISGLGVRGNFLSFGTGAPMTYAKWWRGQPDDYGANESCINLYRKNDQFFMNDWNCRNQGYFICEQ